MTRRSLAPSGAPNVPAFHAWVDESMRLRTGEPGTYILAAVVADPTVCEPTRDALRALLLKGQRRLHWRDEDLPRRQKMINCVADAGVCAIAVTESPVQRTKQERARRVCMERLLHELHGMEVERVHFEARNPSLNQRDAAMAAAMRSNGTISERLWVGHQQPLDEPLLWAADTVAGAVASALCSDDSRFGVEQLTQVINITIR
jgi:hypothetical protein